MPELMNSSKVHFPLPLREGIKGMGKLHPEIQSLIAPTLPLPREGGGNFRLLTRASELTEEQIISRIKAHKDDFHERYGVHRIGLFGSFARKEQTETSDVDIAIEMEPEKKNIHNFLAFKRRLEKELGRKVDLGIESALKPEARKLIEKEIVYV